MIGLVVITHGQLASEYLKTAEMIIGPILCCRAVSIDRSLSVDEASGALSHAIAEVGADEDGVLILTDMFGGTPTNVAADFLLPGQVDILTGVNLPMLIKAASVRNQQEFADLASFLRDYAQKAILRPADLMAASCK